MSKSLGSTSANWFLKMIEKNFGENLLFYPSFNAFFVDTVFVVLNSFADVQSFLTVLNSEHSNLCFTCQEVLGPSLPLLDVKVTICDKKFGISVYCNPIFTSTLLYFSSRAALF